MWLELSDFPFQTPSEPNSAACLLPVESLCGLLGCSLFPGRGRCWQPWGQGCAWHRGVVNLNCPGFHGGSNYIKKKKKKILTSWWGKQNTNTGKNKMTASSRSLLRMPAAKEVFRLGTHSSKAPFFCLPLSNILTQNSSSIPPHTRKGRFTYLWLLGHGSWLLDPSLLPAALKESAMTGWRWQQPDTSTARSLTLKFTWI